MIYCNSRVQLIELHPAVAIYVRPGLLNFFEIDYHSLSMVSAGCCVYVTSVKISIDNKYVTITMRRRGILPEQPKENT